MKEKNKVTVGCNPVNMKTLLIASLLLINTAVPVGGLAPSRQSPDAGNAARLPAFFRPGSTSAAVTSPRSALSGPPRATTTELAMGFRNVLGKIRKRGQRDEDDNEDEPASLDEVSVQPP